MENVWDEKAKAAANARIEAEYRELVEEVGTPEDYAFSIMDDLEDVWLAMAPGKTSEDFDAEIATPFHDRDDIDLDELETEYDQITVNDMLELASWPLIEKPLLIAYGYAVQARLSDAVARTDPSTLVLAWDAIRDASYWQGVVMGLARLWIYGKPRMTVSEAASKAAHVRNAENRAIRGSAFEWLDANFAECKSKDDAAERLTKIVPVAFRTARRYVTQWDLSRASARGV
ncbi:hypothetical protein [Burkholderia pseudomallei]|uniref:hypothetical protein n=1 Tax=Burkholderia pseudomallei TaxID=28450 RepID=UPI0012F508E2|nr:hypothetical protein [Burkholderia pseudomallei]